MNTTAYISLESLAATLQLPQKYLKGLIQVSKIPSLDVNGRLRFNLKAVHKALDKLAGEGGNHVKD